MDNRELDEIRAQFPVLAAGEASGAVGGNEATGNGASKRGTHPFIYLDSAATALTPLPVIEAVDAYYRNNSTNIHRGLYRRSEEATELYEGARGKIARYIGAASPDEVIFTHGATESINLLAYAWAERLGPGDAIVCTEMEHHANLVPWQEAARRSGADLRFIPVDSESGELDESTIERLIDGGVALVAVTGMSNVTGVRPPVERIAARAREVGAKVLLDAAQLAAHEELDVGRIDADFLVFSGHKIYGPTGIGVLWARTGSLDDVPPFLSGGDMIEQVRLEETSFRRPPQRFEAGTPHIAGAAGLAAAIDFIESIGWEKIAEHERTCTARLLELLGEFEDIEIYGPPEAERRSSVVSFNLANVHPHDVGTMLSEHGIAVRAGFHCAQPYVERLGGHGTVRAAIGVYTSLEEIELLQAGLEEVASIFG